MKRLARTVLTTVVLLLIASTNADALSLSPIKDNLAGKVLNQFTLDITLDEKEHQLKVAQSIAYHNNTGKELAELYFNLIPNAFQKQGGGIDMASIVAGGAGTALHQMKETVYKMPLSAPLYPDETVDIQMEYTVRIPNIRNRFGYQENVYNLGNFIITPAVYGADGWAVQPYVDIGDAFYTDIANYTVKINAPQGYTVAATGVETSIGNFRAEKVRDFAFCASGAFETLTDTVQNVKITVYYGGHMAKTASRVLEVSKNALSLYSELLGEYPYETLSVVLNGRLTGGVSGMEYPTLIMVAPEMPLERMEEVGAVTAEMMQPYVDIIDHAVAHEIAHQWFYGIVGNDQILYPWLDEGLCRFAEYLYEEKYPPEYREENRYPMGRFWDELIHVGMLGGNEYITADTRKLMESLYDWAQREPADYSEIYAKGASLLYQIKKQMGDEKFFKALREYVDAFAYGFVSPETFQQFWNEREDFSALFDLYIGG